MKKPFYLVPVMATILTACGSTPENVQDIYKSREDCQADWNPEQCIEDTLYDDNDIATGRVYYGPEYPDVWMLNNQQYGGRTAIMGFHGNPTMSSMSSGARGIGASTHTFGTARVSAIRGGFGSIGAGHAAGT